MNQPRPPRRDSRPPHLNVYAALLCVIVFLALLAAVGLVALGIVKGLTPKDDPTIVTDTDPATTTTGGTTSDTTPPDTTIGETDDPSPSSVVLGKTEDMGQAYQDSIIFIGDSTTAHLRSRGVLTGGKDTIQVWVPSDNTLLLDLNITKKKIVYPKTGNEMTFAEAAALEKPAYMVLTIGLNGVTSFVNNKALYQNCYGKLIDAIEEASPDTKIILQSIFPVATNQQSFSADVKTLNGYIDTVNGYVKELAETRGLRYLDTASCLKDGEGNLIYSYQNGDGIHLTAEGYQVILDYIRTHGYR